MEHSEPSIQNQKAKEKKSKPKPLQQQSDKGSNLLKPEANLLLNQFNANSNVFSQLSAMYLQQKSDSQELDQQSEEFLKKQDFQSVINTPNFDQEIKSILHSLGKKHEVTKLKGLTNLREEIEKRPEDFCYQFIETWVYLYKQFMSSEFERKILEEVNNVLLKICEKNKKCLAQHFKELFPYWFMSMNEANQEIANTAKHAFELALPLPDKRNQGFLTCSENYLKHVFHIFKLTDDKIKEENSALDNNQASEVLERLTVATLNSIQNALQWCSLLQGDVNTENSSGAALTEKAKILQQKLCELIFTTNGKKKNVLIEILEEKKKVRMKAAAIDAFHQILKFCPYNQLEPYLEGYTRTLLHLIDDKERLVQAAMWRGCLITLLQISPIEIIAKCDLKMIENKSFEVLRRAASGIGAQFYSNLIMFLALLPQASFVLELKAAGGNFQLIKEDVVREKWQFIIKFMDAVLAGQQHEEINVFCDQLVVAYFECIYFIVLKRMALVLREDRFANLRKQGRNMISSLIMNAIVPYIDNYQATQVMNIYKQVPFSVAELLENFASSVEKEVESKKEQEQMQAQLIHEEWLEAFFDNIYISFSKVETLVDAQFSSYLHLYKQIACKVTQESVCYKHSKKLLLQVHTLLQSRLLQVSAKNSQEALDDSLIEQIIPLAQYYMQFSAMINQIIEIKPIQKQYYQKKHQAQDQQKASGAPRQLPLLLQDLYDQEVGKVIDTLKTIYHGLLTNLENITNAFRFEKLSFILTQIFYSWYYTASTTSNQQQIKYQQVIESAHSILESFTKVLSSQKSSPSEYQFLELILIIHFTDPVLPETFFSEFQGLNHDRKQEEYYMIRAIENIETQQSLHQLTLMHHCDQKLQELSYQLCTQLFTELQDLKNYLPAIISMATVNLNQSNLLNFSQMIGEKLNQLKQSIIYTGSKNYYVIEKLELGLLLGDAVRKLQKEDNNNNKVILDTVKGYYEQFFEIILFLCQNGMNQKVQSFYSVLKRTTISLDPHKKDGNENQVILELTMKSAQSTLQQQLQRIFLSNAQQDHKQLETFLNFTLQLLTFLRGMRMKTLIQNIADVVLQEEYFNQVIYRQASWVLLRAVFVEVGLSINLHEFFRTIFEKKQNFWILIILMSSSSAYAIINDLPLKKYFLEFSTNFLKPIIMEDLENTTKNQVVFKFIDYFEQIAYEKSLVYANGLKLLIKQIVSENINQDILHQIYQQLICSNVKKLFLKQGEEEQQQSPSEQTNIIRKGIILKNLLQSFQKAIAILLDTKDVFHILMQFIQDVITTYQQQKTQNVTLKVKLLVALDLAFVFLYDFYDSEEKTLLNDSQKLIKFLFEYYADCFDGDMQSINSNFQVSVLFDFINLVIEKETIEPFYNCLGTIEKLFKKGFEHNAKPRKYSSKALIKLLGFLRKVMGIMEAFTPEFKDFAIQTVLDTCIIKLKEYQQVTILSDPQDIDIVKDESNDLVIVEFAETIARFATILNNNLDENLLYELLNCEHPAIQKSCFSILRHFYQNFVPQTKFKLPNVKESENSDEIYLKEIKNPELNAENLIAFIDAVSLGFIKQADSTSLQKTGSKDRKQKQQQGEEKLNQEEESKLSMMDDEAEHNNNDDQDQKNADAIINPKAYAFLLTWISLINKLTSPLSSLNYDQVKKVISLYIDTNKHLHQNFLTTIFKWIDALNFSESEWKLIVKPEEVPTIMLEWSDFLSKESFFKLIIQSLFAFATKFPYYLRYWIENSNNKKLSKLAENLIKLFISNSIFIKEIETIELSQSEWQSEEFSIYASRNTREIFAVYTKEQQKLEVILKLPLEYPNKPIQTEVKKSIKVNQMKINKWLLMMKSLLFNQNNAIKDSLILWKQNLDKEFEGLEECPICYYIIDTSTQELPKLACKTCSYKFHKMCIKRWFDKSNKSECPMCKSQFM